MPKQRIFDFGKYVVLDYIFFIQKNVYLIDLYLYTLI